MQKLISIRVSSGKRHRRFEPTVDMKEVRKAVEEAL